MLVHPHLHLHSVRHTQRPVVVFFLLAAACWWQAVLQATSTEVRISPNKVRIGGIEFELSGQLWIRAVLLLPEIVLLWMELTRRKSSGDFLNKAKPLVFYCICLFNLLPLVCGLSPEFDG